MTELKIISDNQKFVSTFSFSHWVKRSKTVWHVYNNSR
jgi:hypothetical protein